MNTKRLWSAFIAVMVISFAVLLYYGKEIYRQAPPVPEKVVTSDGKILFTGLDIKDGQNVWQSIGGQELGTVWGHGAYQAPDWSADWLHKEAVYMLDRLALSSDGVSYEKLSEERKAALRISLQKELRANTYNVDNGILTVSPLRADAIASNSKYYAGLFTNLAASSFTYINVLHMDRTHYGLMMGGNALCYIAGTFACRRLLRSMSVQRAVAIAGFLTLASGTAMGLAALADVRSIWAYALPFCFYQAAHGIHMPCGQSNAVAPFPQAAGTASALNGFVMMVMAFAMGHWLGLHLDADSTAPLALGVWFWSACTAFAAWVLVRRYGHMPQA